MATLLNQTGTLYPAFQPMPKTVGVLRNIITLGTADVATAGTVIVGYVPANSIVLDAVMTLTDVDTGAAFVCALGDTGDVDRFINGATTGQAAGTVRAGNNATSAASFAAHTAYTAKTAIIFNTITAAATAAAGTASISVLYFTQEPQV